MSQTFSMHASAGAVLLCTLLAALLVQQSAGQGRQLVLTSLEDVTLSKANIGGQIEGRQQETWQLRPEAYIEQGCNGADSYLLLEMYATTGIPRNQEGLPLVFMAARDVAPRIALTSDGSLDFQPPPNSVLHPNSEINNQGTFWDEAGWQYGRSYHRLLIPNFNTSGSPPFWYVAVYNMAAKFPLTSYAIRVTCSQKDALPCPRPQPDRGQCSNAPGQEDRGTCVAAAGSNTTKQCVCKASSTFDSLMWGSFGCDVNVKQLTFSGQEVPVEILPKQWTWFHITVPGSSADVKNQMMLVDLRRSPEASRGSRSVLFLKPVNSAARNVPTLYDYRSYADVMSARLDQSLHYLMTRDFPSADPVQLYIGVWNNNADAPVTPTYKGTLKVTWGTPAKPFACPNDCSGRGQCKDPRVSDTPYSRAAPFSCVCDPGFGGPTCEGTLRAVRVDTTGDLVTGALNPGDWSYTRLDIDPRRFDYKSDSVSFKWRVTDSQNAPGPELINAQMLISLAGDAQGSINLQEMVDRVTYAELAAEDKDTFNVPNAFLLPGAAYTVAVHNSEIYRLSPFRFELEIFVPSPVAAWLHPYLSVVLGITAAIVLCLLMTLCKRMIMQRHLAALGQEPRPLHIVGPDGTPIRVLSQVTPQQQPQGVPQRIIDTFPKFTYMPPADEERRSRPTSKMSKVSKAEREAMQAAAAEAATTAATARAAAASQQQVDVEMSTMSNKPQGGRGDDATGLDPPSVVTSHHEEAARGETSAGDEAPTCSVCLCEYEPGDSMRRLPCSHEFHLACIDKWMSQHSTCPICRETLVPDDGGSRGQQAQQTGISVIFIPQGLASGGRRTPSRSGRSPWIWGQWHRTPGGGGGGDAGGGGGGAGGTTPPPARQSSQRSSRQRQGQPVAEYSLHGSQPEVAAAWPAGSATLPGQSVDASNSGRGIGRGQVLQISSQGSGQLATRPSASSHSPAPLTPRRSQVAPLHGTTPAIPPADMR